MNVVSGAWNGSCNIGVDCDLQQREWCEKCTQSAVILNTRVASCIISYLQRAAHGPPTCCPFITALRTPGMNFSGFCLSPNTFIVCVTTIGIWKRFSVIIRGLWIIQYHRNSPCTCSHKPQQTPLLQPCQQSMGCHCCICHTQRRTLL